MSDQRIVVVTTEPPPLPGLATTGAGLRAWGLACGLRSAGFTNVSIAFAADAVRGRSFDAGAVPWAAAVERGALGDHLRRESPDAVVFQHWPLLAELDRAPDCPVAVDLAGPHLLERRLWGSKDPAGDLRAKVSALARTDFVTCSGQFQRHYFLPFLFQAGFDARAENLCPVIPFSASPDLPEPPPDRDLSVFFYGGMFLPWQDPEPMLRRTLSALERREKGRLVFVGGPHPSGDVSGGRFDALQEFLASHPKAEVHGTLPFDRMLDLMRRSGVLLDYMPRNAERELAFPTRTVTAMWAGLAPIHNDYDELAEPIDRAKAGWVLAEGDLAGLERLIDRLAGHREDVERRSANARRLVRERYTWDRTIAPLAQWCARPVRREATAKVSVLAQAAQETPSSPAASPPPPAAPAPAAEKPRAAAGRAAGGTVRYSPRPPVTGPNRGAWLLSPVVFLLALPISMMLVLVFAMAELARRLLLRRA